MGDTLRIGEAAPTAKAAGIVAATDAAASSPSDSSAAGSAMSLATAAPPKAVDVTGASGSVKLDAATLARLDRMVARFVVAIAQLDTRAPEFQSRIDDVRTLGDEDIKASAQVSSRLLQRPVGTIAGGGLATPASVGTSLLELRRQVDALNPAKQGDLFGTRKLLGVIPFGDRLRNYFAKYQSSQSHLNAIVKGLEDGRSELVKDNADLEAEKTNLWQTIARLREYIYLAQKLDTSLAGRIELVEAKDPEKARSLKEDMLFYIRQKSQDLATQLAVSVQGYLSIDIIRRNNLELVRGVDRASTTTMSALRTAVIVAQAMGDQKLVLDQITALNGTTSNLIEGTSAMLKQQSTAINEKATESTIELEKLQAAFDNIYATLDEIDQFKLRALDTMSATVAALTAQVDKAQSLLDRARPAAAKTAKTAKTAE
jgi:uncharacterized protein YaaN involved in tellurite resistance